MKTLKFSMVMAMIAFTMARLTSEVKRSKYLKDRLYLTLEHAINYHGLILALYQQTQPDFRHNHRDNYLAAVIVEDIQYVILGTYEQWKSFYSMKWDYLMSACPQVIGVN